MSYKDTWKEEKKNSKEMIKLRVDFNLLSFRLLSRNLKIKIYRTIILPVVLHGCETWSLTWREERKLRVFENMALRENIWT